jgi:hypothetical protein
LTIFRFKISSSILNYFWIFLTFQSFQLVGQVFGSSFEAVRKMLMLKWGDLPRNCRIGSEEQEGEEGEGEEMETPAISMNGPKSFLKEAFLAINGTANSAAAGQWSAAVVKILGGRTMFFVATAALAVVNLACFL